MKTRLTVALAAALVLAAPAIPGQAAAASPPATGAPTTQTPTMLTQGQAQIQARRTGKTVPVPGATTPTDTLTANPDGTLTRTMAVEPVRKLVHGAWQPLDATLHRAGDGTIAPALTTNGLTLSGGGSGPMADMTNRGRSLALSLPVALPAPSLSGATATYANLLPGVDLQATADTQGGFREVFVVHNATAARDPRLAALTLATRTAGLSMSADKDGNLLAADATGRPVFTSTAPLAWDSAIRPGPKTDARVGLADPDRGLTASSTSDGPGAGAHRGRIGVALATGSLTLTPPPLLTAPDTVFPVFVDPNWKSENPTAAGTPACRRTTRPASTGTTPATRAATTCRSATPAPGGRTPCSTSTSTSPSWPARPSTAPRSI
jgi:hypothetical protein